VTRGRRLQACAFGLALLSAACGAEAERPGSETGAPAAIQIGAENVVTVAREEIVVGPLISGELRPAREATVRAELGGSVEQVRVDEGQSVSRGMVLGRIEVAALEDTRRSAQSAIKSAEQQLEVTRREAERTEQLVSAGALAPRDLDVARSSVTAAEAQLADARARLVSVDQQLGDAVVRAPIAGILADRAVNAGDVVTMGTALFTIIDPSSMRLEASVPSEAVGVLTIGATVLFNVRGYDQRFEGRLERINPQADPVTRQVPIYVAIPNTSGRLVAGLFAEGRLVVERTEGLVVPAGAVNMAGPSPWVLRVAEGRAERADVTLGLRDERTERVQIVSGVAEKDVLLRGAAQGITPGTPVRAELRR
jgi:membrane fusion protein (multidrug efflux system)